jgi:hypothetical protein
VRRVEIVEPITSAVATRIRVLYLPSAAAAKEAAVIEVELPVADVAVAIGPIENS